jgi:ribosome maturation protein SDO1
LKKGELQVGEKERAVELEDLKREICTEVAGRCVDPNTQRPHTVGMIEKAMNEVGYNVSGGKAAKAQVRFLPLLFFCFFFTSLTKDAQALDLIKVIQAKGTLPIARAQMRVRITMPSKEGKRLKEKILPLINKVEDDEWSDEWEVVRLSSPASFLPIRSPQDGWKQRLHFPSREDANFDTPFHYIQIGLIDPGSFRLLDELLQKEVKGSKKIETMSFSALADGDERID